MKSSYLQLERKLVSIFWMIKKITILYVIDAIPNSPADNKLPTQTNKNVWIISIKVEEKSYRKSHLMNSSSIRFHVVNLRTRSVYA